jgi:hypothetical protein
MSSLCKVCAHPRRPQIEKLLLEGQSYRNVGKQYGISPASICRHQKNGHLLPAVVRATQAAAAKREDDRQDILLDRLEGIYTGLEDGFRDAQKAIRTVKDPKTGEEVPVGRDFMPLAAVANVAHKNIELHARLTGRLERSGNTPNVTVVVLDDNAANPEPRPAPTPLDYIDISPIREE